MTQAFFAGKRLNWAAVPRPGVFLQDREKHKEKARLAGRAVPGDRLA
jgi:hypothetical protein